MLYFFRSHLKRVQLNPRRALPGLALGVMGLAAGCSSVSMPSLPSLPSLPWSSASAEPNASTETLYKEGVDAINRKKYVVAIDRFQKLRADYPFAPEIVAAELKLGEAYYLNEQYTEAVETLKEFQAMHPNNENIPYALYLSGMAHFDQFSSVDRDQKTTEVAKGFFEKVINNYPNSPYAAKSREKMAKCLEYLAEHEYDIAMYYLREKKYPAARDRLEGIVRRYQTTPTAPKALFQLGESYRLEKNNVKAQLAYEALTEHYPTHPLAKNAQTQLSQMAQEKRDPLALLLKPEGRPQTAAAAGNKDEAAEAKKEVNNLVAKTEVVDEKPGDEKGMLGRMVDKINPFSSSSPAPAGDKADAKKEQAAAQAKTTPTAAKNSQLVGSIDESLKKRGIDAAANKQDFALQPPAADLPNITETTLSPTPDQTATLGSIDSKLGKQGKTDALPPPPEAAPALKTPLDQKALASAKAAATPLPDRNALLSNIDSKLKRQGIDADKADEVLASKTPAVKTEKPVSVVTSRTKSTDKVLEPRLNTEKSPLFLQPKDIQTQDIADKPDDPSTAGKETAKSTPDQASAPGAQPQALPALAVKGPPQPAKEKPADAKVASKAKSPGDDDAAEADKGIFDQLKEDFGRVGKILNPFSW